MVSQMREELIPSFDAKLWAKWEELLKYNAYLRGKAESLFGTLMHAEYYNSMAECVRECEAVATNTFQPLYDIGTNDAAPEIQNQRKATLGGAIDQDAETVAEESKAVWENEWKNTS